MLIIKSFYKAEIYFLLRHSYSEIKATIKLCDSLHYRKKIKTL